MGLITCTHEAFNNAVDEAKTLHAKSMVRNGQYIWHAGGVVLCSVSIYFDIPMIDRESLDKLQTIAHDQYK